MFLWTLFASQGSAAGYGRRNLREDMEQWPNVFRKIQVDGNIDVNDSLIWSN